MLSLPPGISFVRLNGLVRRGNAADPPRLLFSGLEEGCLRTRNVREATPFSRLSRNRMIYIQISSTGQYGFVLPRVRKFIRDFVGAPVFQISRLTMESGETVSKSRIAS